MTHTINPRLTACLTYPSADHSQCPSSVECFHAVYTAPRDLVDAVLGVVNPGVVMAPTMGETLAGLFGAGRVVGFRTESGSLYEASCYSGGRTKLHKIVDDRPVLVAEGRSKGAHDRNRGVWALTVTEPSGRYVRTSAITEAWLDYDAN